MNDEKSAIEVAGNVRDVLESILKGCNVESLKIKQTSDEVAIPLSKINGTDDCATCRQTLILKPIKKRLTISVVYTEQNYSEE